MHGTKQYTSGHPFHLVTRSDNTLYIIVIEIPLMTGQPPIKAIIPTSNLITAGPLYRPITHFSQEDFDISSVDFHYNVSVIYQQVARFSRFPIHGYFWSPDSFPLVS